MKAFSVLMRDTAPFHRSFLVINVFYTISDSFCTSSLRFNLHDETEVSEIPVVVFGDKDSDEFFVCLDFGNAPSLALFQGS